MIHPLRWSIRNVIANWEALLLQMIVSLIVVAAAVVPARPLVSLVATQLVGLVALVFPTAAAARLYIDGERAAMFVPGRPRAAFRVFSFAAWLAAGRAMWARVFVIDIVGTAALLAGLFGLTLLIRALPDENFASYAAIVVGALAVLMAMLMLLLWSRKAVVVAVGRALGFREALRVAWEELNEQLGAHLVSALSILVLDTAAAFAMGRARAIAEAAGTCWLLAAFASITENR